MKADQNTEDQIIKIKQSLNELISVCRYFERQSQSNSDFLQEFETASAINHILSTEIPLTQIGVAQIIDLLHSIKSFDHRDGSGWFDYKIRLKYHLALIGYSNTFEF